MDVVQIAGPSVFAANLEGGETLWFIVTLNRPVLHLMARPDITGVEQLRDRAVGVSRLGTFTDMFMRLGLRRLGLEPDRDVTVLSTGGPPESVAAATTGRVAAIVVGPPNNLRAHEAGLRLLLDISTLDVAYPAAGVATTRKVLAERREVLRRFTRAYVEAIHVFRTDAALAQDVIGRWTSTTDPADLLESYRAFRDLTEPLPLPRLEAMKTALELLEFDLPRAREADPAIFYDDSLVREVETSGFLATLGR
jgi:ABC-type nitrate/sulfonate/bicarbonate transport system substrate-binding protein